MPAVGSGAVICRMQPRAPIIAPTLVPLEDSEAPLSVSSHAQMSFSAQVVVEGSAHSCVFGKVLSQSVP